MRWLSGLVLVVALGSVAAACSSGEIPARSDESIGAVSQAITSACSFDTLGLPCDPDGPAGAKLECEGVCAIAISGAVACQAVVAGTLNGVTCGTSGGIGDAACTRYCSGRTCLVANAPAGTACRPGKKSSPCEGQCDGAGKCDNIGNPCDFGRDGQLCQFATCDLTHASTCVVKNLAHNTICSDTDACTIGKCGVTGICVKGPTVGCNDGNPCTDDTCDPNNGGCLGVANDNNSCSDGNACFTGEYCSSGECIPGNQPVDCDDNNECTVDSCDPNTGCAHVQKSCSDGDACTQDVCAPADGSCSHPPVACDDNDPCTDDSCDAGSGCVYTPKNCDDNDACTADACSAGSCTHEAVSCDDHDDCTADSCSANSGCAHEPIVGCDNTGTVGGASAGGETGAAGAPVVADGGASGDANPPEAGQPAVGGTAPAAGSAGTPGSGATSASGGATSSESGSTSTPTGGVTAEAGTTGSNAAHDSSGCGCRVAGTSQGSLTAPWAALILGLGAVVRRRRRTA